MNLKIILYYANQVAVVNITLQIKTPWSLSKRWRKVYFANEKVHFYQLHHEA